MNLDEKRKHIWIDTTCDFLSGVYMISFQIVIINIYRHHYHPVEIKPTAGFFETKIYSYRIKVYLVYSSGIFMHRVFLNALYGDHTLNACKLSGTPFVT